MLTAADREKCVRNAERLRGNKCKKEMSAARTLNEVVGWS